VIRKVNEMNKKEIPKMILVVNFLAL